MSHTTTETTAEDMPPQRTNPSSQPKQPSATTSAAPATDSMDSGASPEASDDESVAISSDEGSGKSSYEENPVKTEGAESVKATGDGPVLPVQKRRRVTRACDECRRKKIKCDGKQPCTHCSVYSYGTPSLPQFSL